MSIVTKKEFPVDKGEAFWTTPDGPCIRISANHTTIAVIGHELLHLLLRVYGFANDFTGTERTINNVTNLLQHHLIYPKYCALGLPEKEFINQTDRNKIIKFSKDLVRLGLQGQQDRRRLIGNCLVAASDFYFVPQDTRKSLVALIEASVHDVFNTAVGIYVQAALGPRDYVRASKAFMRLLGKDDNFMPGYVLGTAAPKPWPWSI